MGNDLHETDNCSNFDSGKDKLSFSVAFDANKVDDGDEDYEKRDKNGWAQLTVPVLDCQGAGYDFERKGK